MTTLTKEEAQKKFNELRQRTGGIDPQELDGVWDALDTVHVDEILGQWKGSDFDTGHCGSPLLKEIRWYGKRFHSRLEAEPAICTDDDGNLYANTAASNGDASLWMVEFRGEVTATMVYDGLPIFDHFKRVDETTLFAIMNGKGELVIDNGQHLYFILEKA